jgi:SAM-dependent methyltransferase
LLETVACDLCGGTNAHPRLTVHDHIYGLPGIFTLVQCADCGLLYLNPRPNRGSIGLYYPDLGYHAFQKTSGLKDRLLARRRQGEAASLLNGLGHAAQVLEIGCGTGELLAELRDRGAAVVGVEPNAAAAQEAHDRHGLTVYTGMLDDCYQGLPPGSFDLIVMKYALEHVHSPRQTLAQIAGLLRAGGRAVFWVPNGAGLDAALFKAAWRGLDAPRHLYIFTPATITRYAQGVGMQVADISFSGVPNDWAGSVEFALSDRAPKLAKWFGMGNPLMMAAWFPISLAAAALRRAGRMRVTMVR